jgi:NADPH:quinone reductase
VERADRRGVKALSRGEALFAMLSSGASRVAIAARFRLEAGAAAQRLLESRSTIGKLLLVP